LDLPTRTATSAGARIASIDLVYGVTGANLTSNTFQGVRSVTYASGALNAIATFGGSLTTGTMQTVSQVTPYLTNSSFGTPAFVNAADRAIVVEWTMVTAASSLATIYGVAVRFSRAD
jgi:hypothetical protein